MTIVNLSVWTINGMGHCLVYSLGSFPESCLWDLNWSAHGWCILCGSIWWEILGFHLAFGLLESKHPMNYDIVSSKLSAIFTIMLWWCPFSISVEREVNSRMVFGEQLMSYLHWCYRFRMLKYPPSVHYTDYVKTFTDTLPVLIKFCKDRKT